MSEATETIGVAVVELAGGTALKDLALASRRPSARIVGVWRKSARDPEPDGMDWIENAGDTVPARRRTGAAWALDEAQADVVVLIEDTTHLLDGWDDALRQGFADVAVGCLWGPVEVSPALPPRFRALGRLEYGRFANGKTAPPAPPGNVLALKAAILARHLQVRDGLVEAELGTTLAEAGQRMAFEPNFRAVYSHPDAHGARLSTRFQHGRLYASHLAGTAGPAGRAILALKGLAAPGLLAFRALRSAVEAGGIGRAATESGWIMLMAVSWGLGECWGALLGPGQSRESWR